MVLLVAGLGCGSSSDSGAASSGASTATSMTAETASSPTPEAPTETATEAVEPPAAPARPARPNEAELAQVRAAAIALRDGRRKARDDDWAAAVPLFERAIEAADSARARCELGWAHYQLGADHHAAARTHLERGVAMLRARAHFEPDEAATLGACLYNLGRVAEETDPPAAAAHYRESLAVRPGNRVVQSRLDALDAPAPAASACEPRACTAPVAGDARAALATAAAAHYGTPSAAVNLPDALPETGFLFQAARDSSDDDLYGDVFLALHDTRGWYACHLREDGDYVQQLEWSEVGRRQWIAGGEPEVDFTIRESWHGREDGIANEMGHVMHWFAGFTASGPVVYGAIRTMDFYLDGEWIGCDGCSDDDDDYELPFECCEDIRTIESVTRWRLVSTGSGRVRATRIEGEGPSTEHALTELACTAGDDD